MRFEIPQLALNEKSIRMQAANIDMQAGATLDLAGGGDLQAYEFSVGPGGSRDILSDAGIYAILPGYSGGFAPGDRQENTGFDRTAGDAVYLSGIPGLPAGVYTLLPAHYALLPGAYAVRLNTDVPNLLPGQAYSKQDGTQVVPGYVTDSRASAGGPRDALWNGFEVLTRDAGPAALRNNAYACIRVLCRQRQPPSGRGLAIPGYDCRVKARCHLQTCGGCGRPRGGGGHQRA